MAKEKVIEVCDWQTVEELTRKGRMADRVMEEILKRMWDAKSGLKQNVFLAFGGASMVFDSPLPGILRLNTYCEDDATETGYGGASHAHPVAKAEDLEDAVWRLLAQAFDDLCDEDVYCEEVDVLNAFRTGTLVDLIAPAFAQEPKDTVFLELWFGEEVSARWLGEKVIFIAADRYREAIDAECSTEDSPADIARAVAEVIDDVYRNYKYAPGATRRGAKPLLS